jgi:hypothetical protein
MSKEKAIESFGRLLKNPMNRPTQAHGGTGDGVRQGNLFDKPA